MANVTAEEPATTTAAGMAGEPSQNGAVNPNRRRIIKAAPPKVTSDTLSPKNDIINNKVDLDKDDEVVNGKKKKNFIAGLNDDPKELAEEWREERLKVNEKRGKALRDKELAERRKQSTSDTANLSAANPFSRFLSVFSVEPAFPEHKRHLEVNGEDDADLKGPVEKRRKPSDAGDIGSSNTGGGAGEKAGKFFSSKTLLVTAAVAVIAGVVIALQKGRKK